MIVTVKYLDDKSGLYAGKDYTYRTNLPLQPLQKVIAPVGNPPEMKKAIVTEINLPPETIAPEWADRVREIERYDHEEKI